VNKRINKKTQENETKKGKKINFKEDDAKED
jgi:hypothetical protein